MGRVRIGTRALRKWKRKRTITRLTMIDSSMSFSFRVAMERSIKSDRS